MPGDPHLPSYHPSLFEKPPELSVSPTAVLPEPVGIEMEFLVHFYNVFRWQEKFDNYNREHKQEFAGLKEIYNCLVDEYQVTVQRARAGCFSNEYGNFHGMKENPVEFDFF